MFLGKLKVWVKRCLKCLYEKNVIYVYFFFFRNFLELVERLVVFFDINFI